MTTEPLLESYLTALDRALSQIAISDRADIITEIKSHILDARQRDPSQSLKRILDSLGEPETVANRYLLERGLKPTKTPAHRGNWAKWLTIGFLGTFGIACLFTIIIVWRFSPLISVDEKNERVKILGGMIDVNGREGTFKMGNTVLENNLSMQTVSGSRPVDANNIKELKVPFSNANLKIETTKGKELRWRCKVEGNDKYQVAQEQRTFVLDLQNTLGSKCEITIPEGVKTSITGANGKLDMVNPAGEVDVQINNGKVRITPDPDRQYLYDLKVVNGYLEGIESSQKKDAIKVKVAVTNGNVQIN